MSALKLWLPNAADPSDQEQTDLTVRAAWQSLVEREHRARGLAESTLRDQRTHLRRFEEWWSNHRSYNPMLRAVGRTELKDWRIWLQQELSGVDPLKDDIRREEREKIEAKHRNVNKHLATVQQVLAAGYAEGIVPTAHHLKPLECYSVAAKVKLSYEEAGALYRACDVAKWPAGRRSVVQWRSFVLLDCVYGMRTQELYAHEPDHEPLRWSNVLFAERCPDNDGEDCWQYGWLRYVPQKQRAKKRAAVVLPLSADARRHLDALRGQAGDADPVFPWPRCHKSFYAQWDAIRREAAKRIGSARLAELDLKQIRKTCHTWHKERGGKEIAETVTGHAPRGVSERHYDVPYGRLIEHFRVMAWPEAFADPLPRTDAERQRLLF
jgi:hypothetical protein